MNSPEKPFNEGNVTFGEDLRSRIAAIHKQLMVVVVYLYLYLVILMVLTISIVCVMNNLKR